ncbi:MAG: T9SS type A sorting domain-containing protein [Ignavibacteria bacterium]|jgi:photosystem II stability/assembly factor-like uncharacterized protein|nr:T9SS type A sorting domain-containing protein [Ignavibacteria bacterium]
MNKIILSVIVLLLCLFQNAFSQPRWVELNSLPATTSRYEDMYFLNTKTGYVVHGNGTMYKTLDGGRTFERRDSSHRAYYRCIGFFDENNGVIGTLEDSIPLIRSTNSGSTWSKVSNITGTHPLSICGISIVNSNTGYAVGMYSCPPFFLKTTNKGESWTSINVNLSQITSIIDCYFWSADSGIVVGGYSPTLNFETGNSVVLFTTNGGASFSTVFKSTRTGEWCWKISFINRNTGFVSVESWTRAVVLKTTNGGLNWTDRVFTTTSDLEGIGFINENTGWIGGWSGPTYMTTNSGNNWSQVPWGYNLNRFRIMSDTLGFALGRGIFKFTRETVGVQQIFSEIPERVYLRQNYPNPFNPETRINYEVRLAGLIILKVYDALGNEITTLVNEKKAPGIYTANFAGSSLPSGVYYYKISLGDYSDTRKMVLIK